MLSIILLFCGRLKHRNISNGNTTQNTSFKNENLKLEKDTLKSLYSETYFLDYSKKVISFNFSK